MKKYVFNCWKILKTIKLQHRDEIYSSVNAVKTEKINCMRARLNPLLFFNGQSAGKFRTGKTSTTIPLVKRFTTGVRLKRVGENPLNGNGTHLNGKGEDIVCSHMKV